MKPEQAEQFLIEELFNQTQERGFCKNEKLQSVDRLTGDASTRRYYRLFTNLNSYVACLDNPLTEATPKNSFVSNQVFLSSAGIRVPQIVDMNLSKGYILEEDLGDVTLLSHLATIDTPNDELVIYKKIVTQLIQLHQISPKDLLDSGLYNLKFDLTKLMDEMEFTFKFFLRIFLKVQNEELINDMRKELLKVCERLSSRKMVLTHRDFHSRNIMIKNKEYIFIDFQDAREGIPQYDLVSLLEDCYYDLTDENRNYLKKYYYDNLDFNSLDQKSYDIFLMYYDDMTIQRVFKAIGSFSYIYATRKDERYLKYIGFGMEKLRKLMLKDDRYRNISHQLFKIYYAN